jgi:hypothetical protein
MVTFDAQQRNIEELQRVNLNILIFGEHHMQDRNLMQEDDQNYTQQRPLHVY